MNESKQPDGAPQEAKDEEKKKKKRVEAPLTRDGVIRRINNRAGSSHESPLATLQEIFEEAKDKDRFVGDTMFWKYFEDIDVERVKDITSVEYRNLKIMFFETIFYVVLLIMFTLYTEMMHSNSVYQARQEQLAYWSGCDASDDCDIQKVIDMDSFWHWMRNRLVPRAFTQYPEVPPEVADVETVFPHNDFTLHFHPRYFGPVQSTVLLGTVRLRALRVKKNKGCSVSKLFGHAFPECYARYSSQWESREAYPPRFVPTYLMPAYSYVEAKDTLQIGIDGKMSSYPGGGFMIDLPLNMSESLMMIDDLRRGSWVDQSTRAVIIELSALNTNVNVIVNSRILFEFGPTGSVEISQKADAAQVFHFTPATKAGPSLNVMAVQILLLVFVTFYACWVLFLMFKTMHNFAGSASTEPDDDDEDNKKQEPTGFVNKILKAFSGKADADKDRSTNVDTEEEKGTTTIWILYGDRAKIDRKIESQKMMFYWHPPVVDMVERDFDCKMTIMPDDLTVAREERWVDIYGYRRDRKKAVNFTLQFVKFARDDQGRVLKDTRNDPHPAVKGFINFCRTIYHYLRYEWNMMDFLILVLFVIHFVYRFYVYGVKSSEPNMDPEVLGHPEKFMPFSRVISPLKIGNNILSVLAIAAWVKLFKYLCMISYFRLLIRILESCAKELIVFSMILLVFFFGFAVCFFVAFGSYEGDFSTISGSFLVLFFLLIDGQKVEPLWFSPGRLQIMPLVFFCYISIVYFVLLNVFLAIVLDVYAVTGHLYVQQHKKTEGKANPMGMFIRTYISMMQGQTLIAPTAEEGLRMDELKIELRRLPGLVRRKWIEKKRKMQRVANESFAGLVLFPDDQYYLMKDSNQSATDWMLPNSQKEIDKMQNPGMIRPPPVYDIPEAMQDQKVSLQQLQRLMDEDETLPLLLGTRKAVHVIQKFKKKKKHEDEPEEEGGELQEVKTTQADVFARIDDLERIPPELEVPDVPAIKKLTEEMSNSLTDVQNQFRIQLTSIIEACAVLFEHLVELTQGIDSVSNNHQQVLELVHQESSGDTGSSQDLS